MKIEKDIILDLLPLYIDKTASEKSRKAIELFAKEDKEIEMLLEATRDENSNFEENEMDILNETKRIIKLRSYLLGFGLMFLFLPLTTYGSSNEIIWNMWRDAQNYAIASILIGVGFLVYRSRVRVY
jgi:uncharacterized membrane protein YcjF (UPF0283 family)